MKIKLQSKVRNIQYIVLHYLQWIFFHSPDDIYILPHHPLPPQIRILKIDGYFLRWKLLYIHVYIFYRHTEMQLYDEWSECILHFIECGDKVLFFFYLDKLYNNTIMFIRRTIVDLVPAYRDFIFGEKFKIPLLFSFESYWNSSKIYLVTAANEFDFFFEFVFNNGFLDICILITIVATCTKELDSRLYGT